MRIEKNILPEYFNEILEGRKKYELRLADWGCNEGDILVLKERDVDGVYTGREIEKEVTHVLKTKYQNHFSEEDVEKYGFQIISFK